MLTLINIVLTLTNFDLFFSGLVACAAMHPCPTLSEAKTAVEEVKGKQRNIYYRKKYVFIQRSFLFSGA